ncbi:hypothetical protein F5Y09DRAFT_335536 [Xylaria sp. FL1042]|nr:hypothetical protein F5Y09DRAFT_335536 [Xylaria sp. FL1042]
MAVAIVTTKTSYGTIRSPLDRQRLLRLSVGAKILGIKFPSEYEGKWAVGWHDNIHAAFETEAVRINVPPENQLKALPRSSSVSAVARWEWDQKDNDGPWLKFRKGDIIQNISWIHADDWYWCGTTSGGWGIFPQSHLDSESITTNALKGRNLRPFSTGSTSTRKEVSSDLESTKLTINEALIRAHYKRSISDEILSTERDIVQKLKGIGLSGQAIGEALHLDETIGGNNDSLFYTNYSAWLVYLADRLGDRYSKTRETAIIEGAIQLAITSMKETMSIGSHEIEWLSDLGTKLEALDATTNNSTTVKTAIFEWEIPSVFCSQDLNDGGDNVDLRAEIRDFVVLSGSDGAFEATTCAQYLDDKFGAAGLEVLETVVDVLASVNISNSSSNIESSPKKTASRLKKSAIALQVEIVSRSCITLTTHEPNFNPAHIACMRWLCEALRAVQAYSSGEPEPGHWLMKSRGSSCLQLGTIKKGTPSIIAFTLEPLQQLSIREIGVDRCWVKLFKSAVIAWAPLKHCWGTGLRLSYEMLVRLSAVTNYVFIDSSASGSPPGEADPTGETTRETTGGLVALGFFTALIPVAYDPATNTTQWHLEVTDNSIMQPENLKILNGKWLQVKSPESFFESHCILGWKGDVSVTLGTREGCYDLEWTDLPRVERVFRLEGFEIGAEIGTGDVLPISLKHSGTFSFKACSTVQSFTASAHYEQAIRLLSHHVALVYDSESQIAWLVPQLSWNLHLCHIWYRHVHYGRDSYDPIPFARLSTEGSSAACEALHMQSELVVLEGLTLNQLFLQIYRNMTSSNRYRQKPRKSLIFGTETMDLIEEPGMGSLLRRLQLPEADQSWQYLAAKADSIGFCKGLGQALTPQNQNSDHTCGCDTIPSNRSLLVAHNTCIERLLRRESITLNALQNSIVDLDYGKEWFMENWPFDTCSHNPENDYWTAANVFMQRIAKPTRWGHCSPIPTTGAFVFGNPPYKESQSWNPNKWLPVSQKSMIS